MNKIKKKNKNFGVGVYNLTPREIINKFRTNPSGLNNAEAQKRLGEFGFNKIEKKVRWKWLKLIFNQFNDALVWILLVAASLAFIFHETRDVTIILIIVFINAAIGFFQEFKAERILDSIKKLTNDNAIVIREGIKKQVHSEGLVPGDIVYITSGDGIPADGYIIESYDLKVNSYIFTGESKPKKKQAEIIRENNLVLADIRNMVYMGESVATGEARFVVTGTGMSTELGKIADLTQEVRDELTPMQKQMRALGKDVTILAVLIGIIVMIAGQYFKISLYQNFLFALALAVSVVPEGLPAAVSVALSLGMKRLLKDHVLAKKLNAVETLGSVSMICTDKTGTITRNELTVTNIVLGEKKLNLSGVGYEPVGNFLENGNIINQKEIKNLGLLFKIGALCNDSALVKDKDGRWAIIGDPTEGAIIVAARKYDQREKYFETGETKITENPFLSDRMRMSVVYSTKGGSTYGGKNNISYVKGSPDTMLDLCDSIDIEGKVVSLTNIQKEKIRTGYDQMSSQALRVLAFAYRDMKNVDPNKYIQEAEKNLVWVGMMAMIDPAREDVSEAIMECKNLGISPVMITGDYAITAEAIAKNVRLIENKSRNNNLVIDGKTLSILKDSEIYKKIKSGVCVFARITPEQKLRIATILKNNNEVIAMTGDGVNDAPALKKADIGVAMGIMGTDVSKEASDMILMDDNFASIVRGVREGRTIFQNLKKFVHYVFTSNASELLTVVFGVILQIPSPLSAIQILAIDLGTDIFPSFALGLEPAEPEHKSVRKNKINSRETIMSVAGFRRILYMGIIMATGAVVAFLWSMFRGGWHFGMKIDPTAMLYIKSTSAAYAVLSMTQMANLVQARSEGLPPMALGFFKNKYAIGAIFISVFMLLSFMYLPFCQKYLGMLPIDWKDWLVVGVTTLAVYFWEEIRKENLNH